MDRDKFRKLLIEQKNTLQSTEQANADASKPVELDQSRVGRLSRMDALQNQAMSLQTRQRRQLQLQKIEAALNRINNGDFGMCLRCDAVIPEKRLEIDPCATLCVTCAERGES